jgi:hypothetical protein
VGDITQSFFFSPKQPAAGGWLWGAGPVVLQPFVAGTAPTVWSVALNTERTCDKDICVGEHGTCLGGVLRVWLDD